MTIITLEKAHMCRLREDHTDKRNSHRYINTLKEVQSLYSRIQKYNRGAEVVNASERKPCQEFSVVHFRDYTFFFSSTDIALASLRNIALPQRSSRKLVN